MLKESVREFEIVITPEAMRVLTAFKNEVALFKLSLSRSCFAEYVLSAESASVGVKTAAVSKALSCIADDETLTMTYDGKSNKMYFKGAASQIKTYERASSFEVQLMEIPPLDIIVSEQPTHDAIFCLDAKQFQKECANLETFHDALELVVAPNKVLLQTASGGLITWPTPTVRLAEGLNSLSGTYDLKYINKFTKAVALCSTVQVGFSKNALLYLSYAVHGGGYLSLILAPKMNVK